METKSIHPLSRRSILLAEDNEDDAFIMQRAFRKAGVPHSLHVAANGEEAIKFLASQLSNDLSQLPAIVLLDLNMPRMGGFEVLDWIRKQPQLRTTVVHILTTSARIEDVETAFDLGANSYMIKPSRLEALIELAQAWYTLAQFQAFPNFRTPQTSERRDARGLNHPLDQPPQNSPTRVD